MDLLLEEDNQGTASRLLKLLLNQTSRLQGLYVTPGLCPSHTGPECPTVFQGDKGPSWNYPRAILPPFTPASLTGVCVFRVASPLPHSQRKGIPLPPLLWL